MDSKENVSLHNEIAMQKEETEEEERAEEQDTMSDCSPVESDLPQIDLPEFSSECSTESISDDESLIEINLPDGNHVEDYPEPIFEEESKEQFIWDFLPESVFKQTGLMELLSEINEEDNMIEIDIARGSIKCSSLGIMA